MSGAIGNELDLFLKALTWGMVMAFGYDGIRWGRRLLFAGARWGGWEDMLFWSVCGIWLFSVVLAENDGILRWYTLAGCGLGGVIYDGGIHPLLAWVLRPVWMVIIIFRQIVEKLLKK